MMMILSQSLTNVEATELGLIFLQVSFKKTSTKKSEDQKSIFRSSTKSLGTLQYSKQSWEAFAFVLVKNIDIWRGFQLPRTQEQSPPGLLHFS